MKKYFMKGTEEEIQFGDEINVSFIKDTPRGKRHCRLLCTFSPDIVDELLDKEIIDVVAVDEDNEEEEETYECDELDMLIHHIKEINERIDSLESTANDIKKAINLILKSE